MGVLVVGLNVITNVWLAAPFLIVLGAIGGYLVVPMNALLQHRGANLMGAGRSIAVQNFNEQACILGLGAFYTGMTRFGLSAFASIGVFGVLVAATMWLIRALAPQQLPAPPRRGRAPARDRPARQALTADRRGAHDAPGRARAGRQRVRLGHVVVAAAPAPGPRTAPALGQRDRSSRSPRSSSPRLRPRAFGQVLRTPALWLLVVAAGLTNAAFNWAVVIGDVVRVVLLFYLMPLWTVLLARLVLGERLTRAAALRIVLGAAGAAIVLWPARAATDAGLAARLPLPGTLADWLGVVGGASFAFNNVMLRREASRPEEGRAMAMFAGAAIVCGALAAALSASGAIAPPPRVAGTWLLWTAGLTVLFLAGNLALQYGAARLPANRTAVVMLSEVLFASLSALALGGGTLSVQLVVGGAFIVAGALLAALAPAPHP